MYERNTKLYHSFIYLASDIESINDFLFRYDDLKPPSSPCPTAPSGPEKKIESDSTVPITADTSVTVSEIEADTAETATFELPKFQPLSPYTA